MQDVDRVLAEATGQIAAAGLDVDTVREVMVAHILGEQPLPLGQRAPAERSASLSPGAFFPE
jgi:antitoxin component of RelBE/YafQ-DinJ toxin-antitoxin module